MSIKKTKKKSSKRIGDPKKRPPVKKQVKRAPAKPKAVLPKEGDYYTALIGDTRIEGIVGKHPRNKSLLLFNNEEGDYNYDDSDLKNSMGFEASYAYDPKHDKTDNEGITKLETSGTELSRYEVITSKDAKASIDRQRLLTVLGYRVDPNSDNTNFSFGCGNVRLQREALVAFVAAVKKLPAQFLGNLMDALNALQEDGSSPEQVNVEEVEAVLSRYPVIKSKKRKK